MTESESRTPDEDEKADDRRDAFLVQGFLAGMLNRETPPGKRVAQSFDPNVLHRRAYAIAKETGIQVLGRRYREIISGEPETRPSLYPFRRRLGEGGQGVVDQTENHGSDGFRDTRLALKVFTPDLYPTADAYQTDMRRIGGVASIVAGIDQGNILNIQGFESHEGIRLMLMKQVVGYDLRRLMDPWSIHRVREVRPELWDEVTSVIAHVGNAQTQFTPGAAVAIIRSCLTALDKLHSRGVVHGDIKPSNIMLTPEGEVKIIDIGSAFESSTSQKAYFCTPEYAAPEVLERGECTPQSDLASLGYVLIELMIGQPVFANSSRGGAAEHSIPQEATTGIVPKVDSKLIDEKRSLPDRLEELLPRYGPVLREFIHKLIAPEPQNRFFSAQEAEVNPKIGGYFYFKQLVLCRLDAHYRSEFRLWLNTLG